MTDSFPATAARRFWPWCSFRWTRRSSWQWTATSRTGAYLVLSRINTPLGRRWEVERSEARRVTVRLHEFKRRRDALRWCERYADV